MTSMTAQQVPAVRNERLQGPRLQERSSAGSLCFGVMSESQLHRSVWNASALSGAGLGE